MSADGNERRVQFEQLFTEHADAVRRYTRLRVDDALADDVVAETFLIAWRRIDELPNAPLPWLLGVARNVAWNQHRSQVRQVALLERLETQALPPHGQAIGEEVADRRALVSAMRRLDPKDQELLLIWAWFDVTASQGAKILGCTSTAYAVRLHRARRRLRSRLQENSGPAIPLRLTQERR